MNWASREDRISILQNLRSNADILAAEIAYEKNPAKRFPLVQDLQRVYTRLAVCDIDAARQLEERLDAEKERDTLCRISLEKMADMIDNTVALADSDAVACANLELAKRFAGVIQSDGLQTWFSTGPYAGLGKLSATIAEITVENGMKVRDGLMELCEIARRIPLDQSIDEEKIEAQVFRDGLRLLRRHLGLNEPSREGRS